MEEDDPLLHEVNKTKGFFEKAKLKCLAQRPGHFSWLSLAQIKNLGSWDVHYPGNPLTPFGPMDGLTPSPLGTESPHGHCNPFATSLGLQVHTHTIW